MKKENGMTATPVQPIVMRSSRVTVTLYHGDCLDLLPIEADAVVTDPPYGIGISQNPFRQKHETKDWDDTKPDDIVRNLACWKKPCIIWGGQLL